VQSPESELEPSPRVAGRPAQHVLGVRNAVLAAAHDAGRSGTVASGPTPTRPREGIGSAGVRDGGSRFQR
jgi:hypothetical protein